VDLHTSTLLQMVAYDVACGGFLDQHVRDLRVIYRERRDAMLTALDHYFPPEVHWTHPQGGLFIWATLPQPCDATDVFHAALAAHVAFVPGMAFFLRDEGRHTMRLSFSHATPEHIHEGIRRLGEILVRALQGGHLL
jgi:DNA-binding transcriptional MocR family regulator